MPLEAEAVPSDLTTEVGLQPCERLHTGQCGGLHGGLAVVDLQPFHCQRHWQRAARGACRCRRGAPAVRAPIPHSQSYRPAYAPCGILPDRSSVERSWLRPLSKSLADTELHTAK